MGATKTEPDGIDVMILTELGKYPPATMSQIGILALRSRVTIRQRIEWLQEQGWVERTPQGKAILTPDGIRYIQNMSGKK